MLLLRINRKCVSAFVAYAISSNTHFRISSSDAFVWLKERRQERNEVTKLGFCWPLGAPRYSLGGWVQDADVAFIEKDRQGNFFEEIGFSKF